MSTIFNKTVMVILLCLIFIGQSMASSTMFYKMAAMSTMKSISHTDMIESNMHASMGHGVTNVDSNETNAMDCSKQECKCSVNGCSVPSAFSEILITRATIELATKIHSHSNILPEQALSSLFRPPIFS